MSRLAQIAYICFRPGRFAAVVVVPLVTAVVFAPSAQSVRADVPPWMPAVEAASVAGPMELPSAPGVQAGPDDGVWSVFPPAGAIGGRKWPGLVFDPVRNRMIVIAGYPGPRGDVWALPLTGSAVWERLLPDGSGPSSRFAHSVIYQPGMDRVVLFGGFDNAFRNDVWVLSLAGIPTWTQITPLGTPPAARWAHAAVYDAARNRMIVFGGYDGSVSRNDAWALTLGASPTWTQLTPGGTPPGPRTNIDGVYDPTGDRLVVFGGFNVQTQQFSNQTWALSLAGAGAWTQLTAGIPPPPRRDHSTIYDAARGRVVIFGGADYTPHNDAWALTLGPTPAWTLVVSGAGPSTRAAQRAIYDAPRDRMVLFGGDDGAYRADTWSLSLGASPAWSLIAVPEAPFPAPRRNFGMTYTGGSILYFGGEGLGLLNDAGELTLGSTPGWQSIVASSAPTPRTGHHAAFDAARNRVLVFGGYDGSFLNDLHAFSLETRTWEQVSTFGEAPSARVYYGLIHDEARDRLLVIGGHPDRLNDVWALRLRGGHPAWSQLSPRGTPPSPRFAHMVVHQPSRNRVILFGGYDGAFRNDVWELSLSGPTTWTELTPQGTPPVGRWAAAAAYDGTRERMIVFGGYDGIASRNDLWALSLGATPAWTRLSPGGTPPSPRGNLEGAYDPVGDRFIAMCGFDVLTQRFFDEALVLDFGGGASTLKPAAAAGPAWPSGRLSLTVARSGPPSEEMVIRYSLADPSPAKLELFDIAGRRLLSAQIRWREAGDHEYRVAQSSLRQPGVYFVRLRQNGRMVSSRLVVLR